MSCSLSLSPRWSSSQAEYLGEEREGREGGRREREREEHLARDQEREVWGEGSAAGHLQGKSSLQGEFSEAKWL